MGLWDRTGHWDLGYTPGGTRENPIDSPVHLMGLWDRTGRWDLKVYPRVGHIRIPLTALFIPWDYGTGQDTGIWK